ncbi:MAG: KOW domain-containing RNA-binding protein [Oscillospiraceae bacterium]|jgi:ribosomal protein L14E/L6E/L27E|nr:KOW domain-containing RNA-binding protein [Oscillospiraceae bacterium]
MESDSTVPRTLISRGDVVLNLNGRDGGRMFYVLRTDGDFAEIADGITRLIEKPKRKKTKHMKLLDVPATRLADKIRTDAKITNAELRRTMRNLRETADVKLTEV